MRRLIIFIVIFALFLAFIVLNLEHRSDISLGLKRFNDIPVFLIVFFSFVLGMLFSIPLSFGRKRKQSPAYHEASQESSMDKEPPEVKKQKKRRFGRGGKGEQFPGSGPSASGRIKIEEEGRSDHIKKEDGPYGID